MRQPWSAENRARPVLAPKNVCRLATTPRRRPIDTGPTEHQGERSGTEIDRFLDSGWESSYSAPVPEISVATTPDGHAYIRLGDGEVRDSVPLGEHDEADRIPTLDSLVLHFDFYGRLTAIEVTGSVSSVLPPGLIDD